MTRKSPSGLRIAVAATVWLAIGATTGRAEGPAPEKILRRAEAVLEHPFYQTELPGEGVPDGHGAARGRSAGEGRRPGEAPPRDPRTADGRRPWGDGSSRPQPLPPTGSAAGPVATTILWGLIAVGLGLAVVGLVREVTRGRTLRARVPEPTEVPEPPAPASAPPAEDEIAALARGGAYGEAVHLLLRRAIRVLGRERPLSAALTSREVLRTAGLAPPSRGAFEELVTAVERFWFGGVPLLREDYERCAAAYQAVVGTGPRES